MGVKTLTLTTASAAALTIGLASPALALASVGDLEATHYQTLGGMHQGAIHSGLHHQVMLPVDGDDDDDEGDDDGGDDGTAEIGGFHRARHQGPRGLCGIGGNIGGFAHGCGEEGDDDDDDDGHFGGGEGFAEDTSNCCGGHEEGHIRKRVVVHRQVTHVPSGAVRSGFGGSQGSSAPLGLAGLSLLVGGAGLVPLARRRMRASGRS